MDLSKSELKDLIASTVRNQVEVLRSSGKPTDGMMNSTAVGDFETQGAGQLANTNTSRFIQTAQGSTIDTQNPLAPWVKLSPEMLQFAEGVKALLQNKSVSRTLSESSDPAGGYTVPEEFNPTVVWYQYENLCMWPGVTLWQMATDKLSFPKLAQRPDEDAADFDHWAGVHFQWTSEGGTKEETEPEWEQVSLIVHELSGYTEITNILLEDSALNLINFLTGLFRRSYLYFTDRSFIRGNGSRCPLGLCADPAALTVNRATAGAVTYADILNMDSKLPSCFDQGAVFLASKRVLNNLRGQVDTNGQPILQVWYQQGPPGVGAGLTTTLIGIPVVRSDGRTYGLGARGDIILVNRASYFVGDRRRFTFDQSREYKFRNNCLDFINGYS